MGELAPFFVGELLPLSVEELGHPVGSQWNLGAAPYRELTTHPCLYPKSIPYISYQ